MIIKFLSVSAIPALRIFFDKIGQKVEGFFRAPAPFKSQAQHIHTRYAVGFYVLFFREHRFVADIQPELVETEFRAPHPTRTGNRDFKGMFDLRHRDVCKRKRRRFLKVVILRRDML